MTNPIIVLGAGIAGLGAAYKLSKENQCIYGAQNEAYKFR